jgi:hypothetical protein
MAFYMVEVALVVALVMDVAMALTLKINSDENRRNK